MANLANSINFLEKTNKDLNSIIGKLVELQIYFTENFNNVVEIRNNEYEFLQDEFFKDRSSLPDKIGKLYDIELEAQEKEFDKNFEELEKQRKALEKTLEDIDKTRTDLLDRFRRYNTDLDREEERLKKAVEGFEKKIKEYNRKIDGLNRGFGFILNLFNMKKIQKEKEKFLKARNNLVKDIERVRKTWQKKEKEISKELEDLKKSWNDPHTEHSLVIEKLNYLKGNREQIIKKATFAEALKTLKGNEDFILELIQSDRPDPPSACPRCKSDNKNNTFFCMYCGERFFDDRLDIQGSLVEVGELNTVFENLLEGMKETVSVLALMKGLKKGVEAIKKSYQDVKASQDRYPSLSTLKIPIPPKSEKMPQYIEQLDKQIEVEYKNLHPHEYYDQFKIYMDEYFVEKNIKEYFESFGDELNKATSEQWK